MSILESLDAPLVAIVFAISMSTAAMAKDELPPCDPSHPIPPGGCLRQDPAPGTPAPPLTVPGAPTAPTAPGMDSPAVIKPPPTGDAAIAKPAPPTGDKMPVAGPPSNAEPK